MSCGTQKGSDQQWKSSNQSNCGRHSRTTLDWEKINSGTAYVVTSQAGTIGNLMVDNPYPIDSTLYFECTIGTQMIEDVLIKDNGERERWVKYLEDHKLRADKIYKKRKH